MTRNCPSCGSRDGDVFYKIEGAPANSGLPLSSRSRAVAVPRGDILLTFCGACGLAFNAAFDPGLILHGGRREETSVFASQKASQQRLAEDLTERYALFGKDILQIGGGRGELMQLLCERGSNHGVHVDLGDLPDPRGVRSRRAATSPPRPPADATLAGPADLVCCSMALERAADPASLLAGLRRVVALRKGARLFLQVPNVMRTLSNFAFWEIHYHQCSYFSPGTLHRLLSAQGFRVDEVWMDGDAQYLMADARADLDGTEPTPGENLESIADLAGLVARFEHECREKQAMWCEILSKLAGAGNRIAIWCAGTGVASFLTTLAVGDEISYVVDVRPSRQGQYTPGTGHRIVAPEAMAAMRPDVVIVMNSALTFEIRDLLAKAGCAPTLLIA